MFFKRKIFLFLKFLNPPRRNPESAPDSVIITNCMIVIYAFEHVFNKNGCCKHVNYMAKKNSFITLQNLVRIMLLIFPFLVFFSLDLIKKTFKCKCPCSRFQKRMKKVLKKRVQRGKTSGISGIELNSMFL